MDFGQTLRASNARALLRAVVFSAWIYNDTGTVFTPSLRIDTANAEDSFSAVTNRLDQTLDACPNAAWTLVSFAFNGTDYTNFAYGVRLYLRLPTGILSAGSGASVSLAQLKVEDGATPTTFAPVPLFHPPAPSAFAAGLLVQSTGNATLSIAADYAVLTAADGSEKSHAAVSIAAVDLTAAGANGLDTGTEANSTWYYLWLISNGLFNVRGLLSLSATAPTLPAGYPYKLRIGAVRNDSSGNLIPFWQDGRRVQTAAQVLLNSAAPAVADTYELVSVDAAGILATLVPPIARQARGSFGVNVPGQLGLAVAGSAAGIGEQIALAYFADANVGFGGLCLGSPFAVPLITAQDFYWKKHDTTANGRIVITGYDLP